VQGHNKLKKAALTGEDSFVVALADWQLGKTDIGGTSQDTVDKILAMIDQVEDRVRELRKSGRSLGTLYVLGLGDMIERCSGFYNNQEFVTDLTEAEQQELAVHLILKALRQWSAMFEKVVVACVVGNHGENRKDGKANTDRIRDNADTSVFKTAALVLNENPDRYGHVSFMIPSDRSTMVLNVNGISVGLAHGNQYSSAPASLKRWWEGQTLGYQPIADATILVTGHYHHLKVNQYGPRTHIQCPAMDPGSRWFSEGSGMESPSGTVTFVVGDNGWSDLQVLASPAIIIADAA
jgi:predicted phosphodiesterase